MNVFYDQVTAPSPVANRNVSCCQLLSGQILVINVEESISIENRINASAF